MKLASYVHKRLIFTVRVFKTERAAQSVINVSWLTKDIQNISLTMKELIDHLPDVIYIQINEGLHHCKTKSNTMCHYFE